MGFRKVSVAITILIIIVAILNHASVEAGRVLPEDYAASYSSAKHALSLWFERLPSGPSPGGKGH